MHIPQTLSDMLFAMADQMEARALNGAGMTRDDVRAMRITLEHCGRAALDLEADRQNVPPILPENVIRLRRAHA